MKARFRHPGLASVLLVCVGLLAARPGGAQENAPEPAPGDPALPLDEWVQAGPIQQIPWEVRVSSPYLRTDQRLAVNFRVRLEPKALNPLGPHHDLFWLVRVQDPSGAWLNSDEPARNTLDRPLTENNELNFQVSALFRPGQYRAVVLLYDRVTDKRSLEIHDVEVPPLRPEPLPEAFRNLPPVEFLTTVSGWDAYYQPELKGKLWLPLATRRPLDIEILVNFSPTKQYSGRLVPYYLNIEQMTGALKPLTELRPTNGTVRVTGFDLNARRVIFEQENLTELDWPRLRAAVAARNPRVVSVEELASNKQTAAFFRDLLAERLRAGAGRRTPADPKTQAPPHRVFIVLSSYILFPQGTDLTRVKAPPDCDCRVYYLRFRLWRADWDELGGVMKRLKPRRFEIRSPRDLRRAIATILSDLGKL